MLSPNRKNSKNSMKIVFCISYFYLCIMCSLVSTANIIGKENVEIDRRTQVMPSSGRPTNGGVTIINNSDVEVVTDNDNKNNYVATTPKFNADSTSELTRYEQGLEDYDEAVARISEEDEKEESNKVNPYLSIVGMLLETFIGRSLNKRSTPTTPPSDSESDDDTTHTFTDMNHDADNDNEYKNFNNNNNSTEVAAVEEGRYIKGDPLNGYYDFIINEGSYKFWSIFQLVTAVIVIYSTFAAIYYSKVNPLTSEYEYVDYFGRSFDGRSLSEAAATEENGGYLQRILHGGWMGTAKHALDFVLEAIEKVPK